MKINKANTLIPVPKMSAPGAFLRMAWNVLTTIVIMVLIINHINANEERFELIQSVKRSNTLISPAEIEHTQTHFGKELLNTR